LENLHVDDVRERT